MDAMQGYARDREIADSAPFRELVRSRNRFMIPAAALAVGGYLVLIALSGFTSVLNGTVVGPVTWTWLLTALIFPLVWLFSSLYRRRAARWDELAEQVGRSDNRGGELS
ncbi:MAG: DUF485 domain-containing protein [Actinophytocola sp.]|nr:DUF485 domain-containing protein [Actinophytocola sp.]